MRLNLNLDRLKFGLDRRLKLGRLDFTPKVILIAVAVVAVSFFISLKAMDWLAPRPGGKAPVLVFERKPDGGRGALRLVAGSPAYLARAGRPVKPDDLARHRLVDDLLRGHVPLRKKQIRLLRVHDPQVGTELFL